MLSIRVYPVAFESLGVRSMCTYIETKDVKILLDAGVSLGPNRFGLPPHPREYEALKERRNIILEMTDKVDIVTVSHYHLDHYTPSYTDWANTWSSAEVAERIYKGKIVFAKSYKTMINASQRKRGWMFARTSSRQAAKLEFADGRSFKFGDTSIRFSPPVSHGNEGTELGWVLTVIIEYGNDRVLFAPDIQGPISARTVNMILDEKPKLLIIGGPPTYLVDLREDGERMEVAVKNLAALVRKTPITILDHHILRDEAWRDKMKPAFDAAERMGNKILTAAEYLGEKNRLLEACRRNLYEDEPPSREFIEWTRMQPSERRVIEPPI